LLSLFILGGIPRYAQGVRELGMGGVVLPGSMSTDKNPAFAAIEDSFSYTTWTLPIGLLGLFMPDRNPLNYFWDQETFFKSFDLLSAYEQFTNPSTFLFNPSRSPDEVVIEIGAKSIQIKDGSGRLLRPLQKTRVLSAKTSESLVPRPVLAIPFRLGNRFSASLGLFMGTDNLRIQPNPALAALASGGKLKENETYEVTVLGNAEAGLSLGFSFATPVPSPADTKLYVGARGSAFLGLLKAEGEVTYRVRTDDQAKPSEQEEIVHAFYSYPGEGIGYGARIDLGVAMVNEAGVFGIGVQNLVGFARWQGVNLTRDQNGTQTEPAEKTFFGVEPAVYLNGAGYAETEDLGRVLVAADLGYDGSVYGHAGVEIPFGVFRVRTGLGYRDGLRMGAGFGVDLKKFKIDVALTSQRSAWDGHQIFGLTAGVSF